MPVLILYPEPGLISRPVWAAPQGLRLIGNDGTRSRIARRGTICLRRLSRPARPDGRSRRPSPLDSGSPTSASATPSSSSPAQSSTVSHSPGSSISGVGTSPLAPVLEEAEEEEAGDDGSSSEAGEELEVVMQTDPEAPGRRTSRGGDAAWWAVGTAEPASTEVRVPESREAAAIAA